MSNAVIVASLLLALYFPIDNVIQLLAVHIVFLVALPLLYIRFLLKEKVSTFGISWGKVGEGSFFLALGLSIIVICLVVLSQHTDILNRFSFPLILRLNFSLFLLYLAIIGVYVFIFEFFFRGFVLFVWEPVIGMKAVVVQACFFIMFSMLLSYQKTAVSLTLVIIMALVSGFIAARSRSIVYSFSFSYISAILGIVSIILFAK